MRAGPGTTDVIRVFTRLNRYGREKEDEVDVRLSNYKLTSDGLMAEALRSMPRPSHASHVRRVIDTLKALLKSRRHKAEIRSLLNEAPCRLLPKDIWRLFTLVETCVEAKVKAGVWSAGYMPSHLFRTAIMDVISPLKTGETIRATIRFETRFEQTRGPTELISEMLDPNISDPELRAPAQNIRHESVHELRDKLKDHVKQRTQRIVEAAWSVIDEFKSERERFLAGTPPFDLPPGAVESIEPLLEATKNRSRHRLIREFTPAQLVKAYALIAEKNELMKRSNWLEWTKHHSFFHGHKIYRDVPFVRKFAMMRQQITGLVFTKWFLPPYVSFAALVLLMVRTAWNSSTVYGLSPSQVKPNPDGSMSLYPLKKKTDRFQPIMIQSDELKWKVLVEELKTHQHNLHLYWGADIDGPLLAAATLRRRTQTVLPARVQARFEQEHSIAHFTLNQLRHQELANTYLTTGDPEQVRVRAQHSDLTATSIYLNKTTLRLLNRATINEFQRRFAATVVFSVAGEESAEARGYRRTDVDPRLFDVGLFAPQQRTEYVAPNIDGAHDSDTQESCLGSEGGRLIITTARIRETILAKNYFQKHLRTLIEVAPGALNEERLRDVEYTFALCEFLRSSEVAHIYHQIEAGLRLEGLLDG